MGYRIHLSFFLVYVLGLLFASGAKAQDRSGTSLNPDSLNLGFEHAARPGVPAHWGARGQGYEVGLDTTVVYAGEKSFRLRSVPGENGRFGVATAAYPTDAVRGETIRYSGFIKTDSVRGGYAGLWWRVDGEAGTLAFENMRGWGAHGTTPWRRYAIEIRVDFSAQRIFFGALLTGQGTAWFDSLHVEIVEATDEPATDEPAAVSTRPLSEGDGEKTVTLSVEALSYLSEALGYMRRHSVNRFEIDWNRLRREAFRRANGAQSTSDTYYAIRLVLKSLGDRHSFFVPPSDSQDERGARRRREGRGSSEPAGQLLTGGIGYLHVPRCCTGPAQAYADSLQQIIRQIEMENPCGWIVDLRGNTGGNMWPMLTGIGPVLGEGTVGSFVHPTGEENLWYYRDGRVGIEGDTIMSVSGKAVVLARPNPPVAVLTDNMTGSSGEAIVVAFRGRPNTKSFGTATYGVSTGNRAFRLSDGATIFLTTSTFADRTGKIYGGPIKPDQRVEPRKAKTLKGDAAVQAALKWLRTQKQCANK